MTALFDLPFHDGFYRVQPSKIVALGLNYRDHIQESPSVKVRGFDTTEPKEPVLFPKLPSSVIASGEAIRLPGILAEYSFEEERTDYEGELAVIIGRRGSNILRDDALDYVLGVTCANDVSQRNVQNGDRSGWFRGKSFDTFLPLGPRLVALQGLGDLSKLSIETRLNGTVVQSGNTAQMIFSVAETISYVSRNFTLEEGDVILTGTPAGVGPIRYGDVVEVEIEGIGVLSNPVEDPRRT